MSLFFCKGVVFLFSSGVYNEQDRGGCEVKEVIYLDHAATSWPKPPAVGEAMLHALDVAGANPGRGSHRMAVQASRVLLTRGRYYPVFLV